MHDRLKPNPFVTQGARESLARLRSAGQSVEQVLKGVYLNRASPGYFLRRSQALEVLMEVLDPNPSVIDWELMKAFMERAAQATLRGDVPTDLSSNYKNY